MSPHDRYQAHRVRIRGSIEHTVGEAPSDAAYIKRRAREAYHERHGIRVPRDADLPGDLRLQLEV